MFENGSRKSYFFSELEQMKLFGPHPISHVDLAKHQRDPTSTDCGFGFCFVASGMARDLTTARYLDH